MKIDLKCLIVTNFHIEDDCWTPVLFFFNHIAFKNLRKLPNTHHPYSHESILVDVNILQYLS